MLACRVKVITLVRTSVHKKKKKEKEKKKKSRLPDSPNTIHLSVMNPESGVAGGGEQITTGITADGVVDTAVGADLDCVGDALGDVAEGVDVGGGQHVEHGGVVGVPPVHGRPEVSPQLAGVVSQPAEGAGRHALEAADGAQVDRHIGEGAGGDEAAAHAGGEEDVAAPDAGGRDDDGTIVGDVLAVTA